MSKKGVAQKHSKTAVFAALRRALANKEYNNERFGPDYLAEYFLPPQWRFLIKFKKIRANVLNKLNGFIPGMQEYLIARTAYYDSIFVHALNENIPQIVLMGAGYDTRAYRFAERNAATKIFELDVATTQNRKRKCLKRARLDIPGDVLLVPINFDEEPIRTVLEKAGYDHDRKTLFLWEGVCYYLEPESVDATLEFVSQSSHGDSVIAFDYVIPVSEKNMDSYYGVRKFTQTMDKAHSEERFKFAIDEGAIESFLEERGLKLIDRLDNKEIEERFLMHENGSSIGKITGLFRLASASPAAP